LKPSHLVVLAAFFIVSCKSKKEVAVTTGRANAGPQTVVVDVIVAGFSSLSNVIEVNGTVVAYESTDLHPEISGRLTYLNIPEGARIGQGAVLARINNADLLATLNKSRVQLELAEKTEARLRKLLTISGINQADYDAALNQVNSLKADMVYTQAQLDKTTVRAPFSGTLGLRMVSPGAYVTPQSVLATLQQTDRVKIDFTVPESYTSMIHKGGIINVQPGQTGDMGKATIIATEPLIDANSRNLKVRAVYLGGSLNPGSFVKVKLNAGATTNSVLVPTSAIIPDAKAKKLVVVRKGKGVFVDIETGLRNSGTAEVIKGIKPGDSVVVTGVLFVRPNSPVRVRGVKKLEDFNN
jgi:membrane fusion protein (multidrug efflux system)